MEFLIGLAVGFVVGWVFFRRPQWSTDLIGWLKKKIGMS